MRFKLPSKPRLITYGVFATVALIAGSLFFDDSLPPKLDGFSLSETGVSINDPAPQFSFEGRITDDRGVTGAEFQCLEDGEARLLIYLAMAGSDRNRVSFGKLSGSFGWAGRWFGTAYDLSFEGNATLPPSLEAMNCQWHARVRDILGNESFIDTGVSLSIKN